MNVIPLLLTMALLTAFAGCDAGPKSGKGFTLPEGSADRGQTAFTQLRCYDCHSVSGVELPAAEEPNQKVVRLGGQLVYTRREVDRDLV